MIASNDGRVDQSAHRLRVERLARDLIAQYGARAVHVVVERINKAIDDHEHPARDFWAEVAHAVLEQQRLGGKVD